MARRTSIIAAVLQTPGKPAGRAPGRALWAWVIALTAIGLVGGGLNVIGGFIANFAPGGNFKVGCSAALGALLFFAVAAVFLLALGLVGVLAAVGAVLFWRGSRWGPVLLVAVNLAMLALFGFPTVFRGQVLWGAIVVLLAMTPAVALALLVQPLVRWPGQRLVVAVQLAILSAFALPAVVLFALGLTQDVTLVVQPAPSAVAAAGCAAAVRLPSEPGRLLLAASAPANYPPR
jgi:hypothetical protein